MLKNKNWMNNYTEYILECTSWQNSCHIIQASIDNKLQWQIESHYNNLNKKLDGLQVKEWGKTKT